MEFERTELPHEDPFRWRRLQALYKALQTAKETRTLVSVLLQIYQASGHDIFSGEHTTIPSGGHTEWNPFTGLKIFLDNVATTTERTSFFETILPKITSLAALLDRYALSNSLLLSRRRKAFQVSLSKNFVASILASDFLCAFPPRSSDVKTKAWGANFINLYGNIQRSENKDRAVATLRCFLQYFDKLSLSELDTPSGEIVFERQVVRKPLLPSIADWESSDAKLCPLIVDHQKSPHDSEMSLPQVDCCGCFSRDFMTEDHLIMKPEAFAAMLFMEALDDNEMLTVKYEADGHVERFVGWSDRQTIDSQRELILKYLNKALVCFQSQDSICELMKTKSIHVGQNGDLNEFETEDDNEGKSTNPRQEDASVACQILHKIQPVNINIEVTDINGNISVPGIDTYCDSLVGLAYSQARGEIDINSEVPSEDRQDTLENLMKKSLHEVFWKTPEKERIFTDSIIDSPLLPKCLLHFHSDSDSISPTMPTAPPSTPAKLRSLSNSSQTSFVTSPDLSRPLDQLRVGTKSFADSLAQALMSCVLLSSSLATSIATEALDSLSITSVTMEMLQKSPKKVLEAAGQNGRLLQSTPSFSSNKKEPHLDKTSFYKSTNEETDSGLIDSSPETSSFHSDEEQEARRRSLNELALNLFENFATKLAHSIIQNSTRYLDGTSINSIDEEYSDVTKENSCSGSRTDFNSDVDSQGSDVDSQGMRNDINHEDEARSDKSTDTDSDISEGQWYGLDIDKEIEDRFYELDLTDDEDNTYDPYHTNLAQIADGMLTKVFGDALAEVTTELEAMDTTVEYLQQEDDDFHDEEITVEILERADSADQNHFMENSSELSSDVFQRYALDLSTQIVQSAVDEFASDADSLSFSTTPLSQSSTDFDSTTTGKEKSDEDRRESYDSNISNQFSLPHTGLVQYAEVLSEQLMETSIAIAGLRVGADVVHPVATSRWCSSEDVGIDLQMEAILQWIAASVVGCPALTFHTMCDERLEKFSKLQQTLRERHYRVRDVLEIILRYFKSDTSRNLFQFLTERIS